MGIIHEPACAKDLEDRPVILAGVPVYQTWYLYNYLI